MRKGIYVLSALAVIIVFGLSLMGPKESEKLAGNDKYKVIKVDGKILFESTKENMKIGDVFLSGMALSFQTPQSRAAVISSISGRFVLSPSEKGQTKILPAANNISSRAGALINMIDLKNHFAGKFLVLNKLKLELGEDAFPMNEESFFYLTYEYEGEQIRKKLESDGNKLILDKNEIYKIDGEPIPVEEKEMTLYYRSEGKSQKVNTFTPVFPDLNQLKLEVSIILEEFADKDNSVKIKEVNSYLNEFYGSPQSENLAEWMKTEFQLQ